MPSLDDFKAKQKIKEAGKAPQMPFQPKRYAPYLLQEEVIKEGNSSQISSQLNRNGSQKEVIKDIFPIKESNSSQKIEVDYTEDEISLPIAPIENVKNDIREQISRLYGLQKTILLYVVEICLNRDSLITGPITSETLVAITGSTAKTLKKIIQRLIEKQLLQRKIGKRGRGGFSQFIITEQTKNAVNEYSELIKLKISPNSGTLEEASSYLHKNTQLPKEWQSIDYAPLEKISFTRNHLLQLFREGNFEPQMVQDSIYYFAFDLDYNNKAAEIKKTTPIGYFMGTLLKRGPYNAPSNYESAQQIAMRKYLEVKKAELEKKEQMEKELLEIHLKEWIETLSEEQIKAIARTYNPSRGLDSGMTRSELREHFKQHEWSTRRAAVFK